ncbi:MAG: three-Cys-motif partner protein TcmP [Sedimentisphaerales bacterium]|nr:three-Cys-motif partner protein TcmP [Sedimentisphaerales bacterium]
MAQKKENRRQNTGHMKGHRWTRVKLERVASYLPLFTEEMRGAYRTSYIDAFAGTGKVDLSSRKKATRRPLVNSNLPPLIDGSGRMALRVVPRFDRYVFNDNETRAFAKLIALRQEEEFQDLRRAIAVRRYDANTCVKECCRKTDWTHHRAVLFLDPRGLQVEWTTLEAVAHTGAIDVWYLFPLDAVNRLLKRHRPITTANGHRLDLLFGSHNWYETFYKTITRPHLFGEGTKTVKTATHWRVISRYSVERLKTIFPHVAEKPLPLEKPLGIPIFLLCFATADSHAQKRLAIAQKILSIPSRAHGFPARLTEPLSSRQR